ncbi:hypothetical protein QQ008_01700 [Fulvivirgaceae bacterium BMA10]|uniref:Uncharacterized protein n=1 Tax=Splendidivirga corallicola TaxID=3051826 RepID=A0ABT8KH45_9BACT|nr:hypothetical protein [Fulvivirgaceae bacterium BMA10]
MKQVCSLLLLLFNFNVFSQSNVENHIQEIRKRYYHLINDDVNLVKSKIGKYNYYFEENHLRKVSYKTDSFKCEYYFDEDFIRDYAYFIYTVQGSDDQKIENRYYFAKDNLLIRWLDRDKREVKEENKNYCERQLKLIAKSTDLLTILRNHRLENLHPDYKNWVGQIDSKVKKLMALNLVPDTTQVNNVPDEYYYSHTVEFKNSSGILVKHVEFHGGDHGSSTSTSFFDLSGRKIYELTEGGDVFGHSNVTHQYFNNGEPFRIIYEKTVHGDYGNCTQFSHKYVAEIDD